MLTTILSIGQVLRAQHGAIGFRYHRYVKPAPIAGEKQFLRYLEVPVADDMSFDLSERQEVREEGVIQNALFYLNYKTSDADSMKKYVFGDICRFMVVKKKDGPLIDAESNFLLGDSNSGAAMFRLNSFDRGCQDSKSLSSLGVDAFRCCLDEQRDALLAIFVQEKSVYINFRFGADRKHWYEMEPEFEAINRTLLQHFVTEVPGRGYTLTKSLYKTLAAGKGAAPGFDDASAYKNWVFRDLGQVQDLLYAIDLSQRAQIKKGSVKIVVLPRSGESDTGEQLTEQDIRQFFEAKGVRRVADEEQVLADTRETRSGGLEDDDEDDGAEEDTSESTVGGPELTEPLRRAADAERIQQFDFVFSKASSSASTPDVDVVELAGVSRSRIGELDRQIRDITARLYEERRERLERKGAKLKKGPPPLRILNSLNNVIGDVGRDKKKLSSHLLKVLPQIYCGSYLQDDLLLPQFLATVERQVRDGMPGYDFLRFDLLFLLELIDRNREDSMSQQQQITDSDSYRIGALLGKMARPLRQEINSFEKNYVGLLSRRVALLSDVVEFTNYLDQKLILHERAYPDLKAASREVKERLRSFAGTYNREHCVFGFFESYFEPLPSKPGAAGGADSSTVEKPSEEGN